MPKPSNIINLAAARSKRLQPPNELTDKKVIIRHLIHDIAANLGVNLEAEAEKRRRAEEERIERLVAERVSKIVVGRAG